MDEAMLKLPKPDAAPEELADWAELCCLFGERSTLGAALLSDVLQEELAVDDFEDFALGLGLGEEELPREDEAQGRTRMRDQAAEGLGAATNYIETILARLSFRRQVVGSHYQIALGSSAITRTAPWEERPIYPFLALLGARMLYKLDWKVHEPARLFERVVAVAAGRYLSGRGERFGWPPADDEGENGKDFKARVRVLARRMDEDLGLQRNIGPSAKDYGLDVVAWRGFGEGRTPGQLILLCQCAIGEDWNQKLLSVGSWHEVVNFNVRPVSALAFPRVPSRAPEDLYVWHDITTKGALPLDRLRLAALLEDTDFDDDLLCAVKEWLGQVVPTLPFLEAAPD
jgi:hypothetical protein